MVHVPAAELVGVPGQMLGALAGSPHSSVGGGLGATDLQTGWGPRGHRAGALEEVVVRAVGSKRGDLPQGPCDGDRGGGFRRGEGRHSAATKGFACRRSDRACRRGPGVGAARALEFPLKAPPPGLLSWGDPEPQPRQRLTRRALLGPQGPPDVDAEFQAPQTVKRMSGPCLLPLGEPTPRALSLLQADGSPAPRPPCCPCCKPEQHPPCAPPARAHRRELLSACGRFWLTRAFPRPRHRLDVASLHSAGSWLFF